MKKTYESPQAELLRFAAQDALTASDISGAAGINWDDVSGSWS